MKTLSFKQWLMNELVGTGAVYDPKAKGDFNWWGAVGDPLGKTIKGQDPIQNWTKKKKKKKRKRVRKTK